VSADGLDVLVTCKQIFSSYNICFGGGGSRMTYSKSKSCYDRRSVGQAFLVSSPHLWPKTRFLLLSHSCGFVDVRRPLRREDGSIIYNYCGTSPAQSFSCPSHYRILLSEIRESPNLEVQVPAFISPRNMVE
jgi:hypothetical protein